MYYIRKKSEKKVSGFREIVFEKENRERHVEPGHFIECNKSAFQVLL
jgi:hypothetical protein